MGNKPRVFQQSAMCVQTPTAIPQSNVKHIFHPFMATTQIALLTGHRTTAYSLICELSAAVLVNSDQQTKKGNVHVT